MNITGTKLNVIAVGVSNEPRCKLSQVCRNLIGMEIGFVHIPVVHFYH